MYDKIVKRLFDILISSISLVLLSPILFIVGLLVRVKLGKPIIFAQDRVGRIDKKTGEERIFKLYKFRSMTEEKDENGNYLPKEVRLTPFGKKLRATSLDELPELINILKGDMSLVGPRPLLIKYIPLYTPEQRKRHLVRPGLTGYAQVNGRNAITWEKKFEYDVEYTKIISFITDLKILLKTIKTVLKKDGIGYGESDTMEEFKGGVQ